MDCLNRKIAVKTQNILKFIQCLAAGKYLIPTFQRLFVWNPEDIVNLWDSIYQSYPVGSILCWETKVYLHVHRRLGGFYIPDSGGKRHGIHSYILDGQQRATAMLASFYGGAGKVKEHYSFDYTMYFDLLKSVFFFEKDYYKHRWDADAGFLVRLNDTPSLPEDYGARLAAAPGFIPDVAVNLDRLRRIFVEYSIPLIVLKGFDVGGVCAIYERINQTGMKLKNLDILIARGFKNYSTVVEEDFPITGGDS